MSDFDTALERLLNDPGFARALAADPTAALAGYRLSDEEVAVLTTQVTEDAGGQHAVEARTSQSSLAGMLTPFTSAGSGTSGFGTAPAPDQGLGTAPATEQGLGAAPVPERGLGAAPPPEYGSGAGFSGAGGLGAAPEVPDGYETRVDADGDGTWDAHTLHATPGGGVDIEVDLDGDGQADFTGHDEDADGLVDWSGYDRDGDATFETRMYDDDGDGWMDRTETGDKG